MSSSRCPNCGMSFGSGSYYTRGMTLTCTHCGYKGQAMNSLYGKMKGRHENADMFKEEMGIQSLSAKLALVSLFVFIVSVAAGGLKTLAVASLAGFVLFSFFYGFLRVKK